MAVIELVQEKTVTSEADRARRVGASKATAAAPEAAAAAPQAAVEPEAVAEVPTADEATEAETTEAEPLTPRRRSEAEADNAE